MRVAPSPRLLDRIPEIKLGRIDEARTASRRAVRMLRERQRPKGTRWESDVANYTLSTLALVEASLGNAAVALPL